MNDTEFKKDLKNILPETKKIFGKCTTNALSVRRRKALLVLFLLHSSQVIAGDKEISCVSVDNQIALRLNSSMTNYILTDDALSKNECPAEIYYSIDRAKDATLSGWKIFYGESITLNQMIEINSRNREVLSKSYKTRDDSNVSQIKFDTFQVGLRHTLRISKEICHLNFDYDYELIDPNIGISVATLAEMKVDDFCLSLATIFAANGVAIMEANGSLTLVRP